jgi:hypothetical protein
VGSIFILGAIGGGIFKGTAEFIVAAGMVTGVAAIFSETTGATFVVFITVVAAAICS